VWDLVSSPLHLSLLLKSPLEPSTNATLSFPHPSVACDKHGPVFWPIFKIFFWILPKLSLVNMPHLVKMSYLGCNLHPKHPTGHRVALNNQELSLRSSMNVLLWIHVFFGKTIWQCKVVTLISPLYIQSGGGLGCLFLSNMNRNKAKMRIKGPKFYSQSFH
jgi:hypothetical protein